MKMKFLLPVLLVATVLSSASAQPVDIQTNSAEISQKTLKRKIAIGRFTNETRYGQTLLRDPNLDPLGKQAADILSAYLVQTNKFLVFERTDLSQIRDEQGRTGGETPLVGVDTLIFGSIVEFGRTEDGKRGLFNKEKTQRAHAKVAIRLVDVRTGLAFHSATGSGEATTETKTTLGMGSTAKFDGTLTDKALSVAVEDVLEELVSTVSARPWRTDILAIEGTEIYVSGGPRQGLKVGDRLSIMQAGKAVQSMQTGMKIELPAKRIAGLEVVSHFGNGELDEASVTRLTDGSLSGIPLNTIYVVAQ